MYLLVFFRMVDLWIESSISIVLIELSWTRVLTHDNAMPIMKCLVISDWLASDINDKPTMSWQIIGTVVGKTPWWMAVPATPTLRNLDQFFSYKKLNRKLSTIKKTCSSHSLSSIFHKEILLEVPLVKISQALFVWKQYYFAIF